MKITSIDLNPWYLTATHQISTYFYLKLQLLIQSCEYIVDRQYSM